MWICNMKKLTTDEFIKKAAHIHGEKYDYSKSKYIDSRTKISITCPDHGDFLQTPSAHIYGSHGCPSCNGGVDHTLDIFLDNANKKHGHKYDYSKAAYINSATKVDIICNDHGMFSQRPVDHLHGQGCPMCGNDKNRKDKEFIQRANVIHNNKYDYSKVEYHRVDEKVIITCPTHGDWWTRPTTHLSGHGCPKCAHPYMTLDEFLQKAFDIHGPKYEYDGVNLLSSRDKITITCSKHGDFEQRAGSHLSGGGCPDCQHDKRRLTTEIFIERSIKNHDIEYDYSKVIYTNSHHEVTIICPDHGEFQQKAYQHLEGKDCRLCKYIQHPGGYNKRIFKQNPELAQRLGIFYIVQFTFSNEEFIKIGITVNDAKTRHHYGTDTLKVLAEFPMTMADAFHKEQAILRSADFKKYRYKPKNIKAGVTECFKLDVLPLLF